MSIVLPDTVQVSFTTNSNFLYVAPLNLLFHCLFLCLNIKSIVIYPYCTLGVLDVQVKSKNAVALIP